jgi:hypothetical protein
MLIVAFFFTKVGFVGGNGFSLKFLFSCLFFVFLWDK